MPCLQPLQYRGLGTLVYHHDTALVHSYIDPNHDKTWISDYVCAHTHTCAQRHSVIVQCTSMVQDIHNRPSTCVYFDYDKTDYLNTPGDGYCVGRSWGRLDLLAAKYWPPDPMRPRGLSRDRQGRVGGGGAAQAWLCGQGSAVHWSWVLS